MIFAFLVSPAGAETTTKVPIFVMASPSESWDLSRFPVVAYCIHDNDLVEIAQWSTTELGSDGVLIDNSISYGLLLILHEGSANIRVVDLATARVADEIVVDMPSDVGLRTLFPVFSDPLRIVVQYTVRDADTGIYSWPVRVFDFEKRSWLPSDEGLIASTLIAGTGPWHRHRNASYRQGLATIAVDQRSALPVGIDPPSEFMGEDELLRVLYRNQRFAAIMNLRSMYSESEVSVAVWDSQQESWSYLTIPEPIEEVSAFGEYLFFELLRKGSPARDAECSEDVRYRSSCSRHTGSEFHASRNKVIYEPASERRTDLVFDTEDSRLLGIAGSEVLARQGQKIVRFAVDKSRRKRTVVDSSVVGGIQWMFMADQQRLPRHCDALPEP